MDALGYLSSKVGSYLVDSALCLLMILDAVVIVPLNHTDLDGNETEYSQSHLVRAIFCRIVLSSP
jgi:hypothetical protein